MDNQLLQALKSMLQEELQPIKNELKDLKEEQVKSNERLDRLESKVDRVESKVDNLESKVDNLETKVDKLERNQVEIKERLEATYTRRGELSEFRTEINLKFEDMATDIVAIEALAGKNTTDIARLKALNLRRTS